SFCSLDCSGIRRRPVCGSDGRTIPHAKNLKVGHRGECLTGKDRCGQERATAQENNSQSGIDIFVPECTPSGAYVSVQCHYGTGYCWCVNEMGKPVPGSSVRYKKPNAIKKVRGSSYL
ncbi:SPARCrelated modular calciumbinding protein 1like, partial [Caligus rogercresseyi]